MKDKSLRFRYVSTGTPPDIGSASSFKPKRTTAFQAEGRGFDSRRAHQLFRYFKRFLLLAASKNRAFGTKYVAVSEWQ